MPSATASDNIGEDPSAPPDNDWLKLIPLSMVVIKIVLGNNEEKCSIFLSLADLDRIG